MNRYPHNRWAPAFGFAAMLATAATIGLAVVLPAKMPVRPTLEQTVLAKREARPAEVTVTLERVDVVAPQPAVATADARPRG